MIDPIRAGHVAIFDQRFHFFCDYARCRGTFLTEAVGVGTSAEDFESGQVEPSVKPTANEPILSAFKPALEAQLPVAPPREDDAALVEPISETILSEVPPHLDGPEPKTSALSCL